MRHYLCFETRSGAKFSEERLKWFLLITRNNAMMSNDMVLQVLQKAKGGGYKF
jgi:hypothetical protein